MAAGAPPRVASRLIARLPRACHTPATRLPRACHALATRLPHACRAHVCSVIGLSRDAHAVWRADTTRSLQLALAPESEAVDVVASDAHGWLRVRTVGGKSGGDGEDDGPREVEAELELPIRSTEMQTVGQRSVKPGTQLMIAHPNDGLIAVEVTEVRRRP